MLGETQREIAERIGVLEVQLSRIPEGALARTRGTTPPPVAA